MREIGAFEAKNTLGALLDLVERGEEIVITRRGRPVARLIRESGLSIGKRRNRPSPRFWLPAKASLWAA